MEKKDPIILELYADLPSALQVQSGARAGMPVRKDTTMFAQPVKCRVVVEDSDPLFALKSACRRLLSLWESGKSREEIESELGKIAALVGE